MYVFSNLHVWKVLFLRCALKTHVESVAESMGSIVDLHSEKRRGIGVTVVGEESMIHWNGPLANKANGLLEEALDRHFGAGPFLTY